MHTDVSPKKPHRKTRTAKPHNPAAEYQRPKHAAPAVGIGRNYLYELMARPDVPQGLSSKLSPRCRLIHMPTLKAWISALGEVA